MVSGRFALIALVIGLTVFTVGEGSADVLVPTGASFRYAIAEVDDPVDRIAEPPMAALDGLLEGRIVMPRLFGEVTAPAAFPAGDLPLRGVTPFVLDATKGCRCTPIEPRSNRRVAALYATTTFRVDEPGAWSSLTVRARYRDAIVIYVNGREVVRSNLPRDASPATPATRLRGPEWEAFSIPIAAAGLTAGINRISAEVRPFSTRTAPQLDLEVQAHAHARIVRGPVVQRLDATSVAVRFATDVPVRGSLEWGTDGDLGTRVLGARGELAMEHRIELDSLPVDRPFYYRVRGGAATTKIRRVNQWPGVGEPLRFAVYGDMRGGHDVHQRIVAALAKEAIDLVLVTGDLVLRGSDEGDWQRFFSVADELLARVPYFPVAGNHDLGRSGPQRREVAELFELPPPPPGRRAGRNWYAFEVAGAHFIVLDSNHYRDEAQLSWLETALRKARGSRAIFAFTHDGPYSRGLHGGNLLARERYVPLLRAAGVTLLFSGHDHLYQRGEVGGLRYVVSGGGGAPLYSVRCGGPGQRRCAVRDGADKVAKSHHYIVVTLRQGHVELCPRRPDGSPLEDCTVYPLRSADR